jgi:hypothetical protein
MWRQEQCCVPSPRGGLELIPLVSVNALSWLWDIGPCNLQEDPLRVLNSSAIFKNVILLAEKKVYGVPISEKSSTRTISLRRWGGDRSITEWTVRKRTDHASLWKHITTLVAGSVDKYRPGSLHLQWNIFFNVLPVHQRSY